jgi:hypothetical protein
LVDLLGDLPDLVLGVAQHADHGALAREAQGGRLADA